MYIDQNLPMQAHYESGLVSDLTGTGVTAVLNLVVLL